MVLWRFRTQKTPNRTPSKFSDQVTRTSAIMLPSVGIEVRSGVEANGDDPRPRPLQRLFAADDPMRHDRRHPARSVIVQAYRADRSEKRQGKPILKLWNQLMTPDKRLEITGRCSPNAFKTLRKSFIFKIIFTYNHGKVPFNFIKKWNSHLSTRISHLLKGGLPTKSHYFLSSDT